MTDSKWDGMFRGSQNTRDQVEGAAASCIFTNKYCSGDTHHHTFKKAIGITSEKIVRIIVRPVIKISKARSMNSVCIHRNGTIKKKKRDLWIFL